MEFTELIEALDKTFEREIVHIKKYYDSVSYSNPSNATITINETEYTPIRLCFLYKEDELYFYINTINRKYHKIKVSEISDLEC